ncbi:hypothetical protein HU200_048594 [Digitaria exilis]|uniref:Leucine zipper homeobox-associated domain-containing protein n=1 Tax=Digitaria exilis TaxID=1010633 RepID=A0A835AVG7_9POAL|nr:hypothetical protein HU200_048594 [Digitaria exilis]
MVHTRLDDKRRPTIVLFGSVTPCGEQARATRKRNASKGSELAPADQPNKQSIQIINSILPALVHRRVHVAVPRLAPIIPNRKRTPGLFGGRHCVDVLLPASTAMPSQALVLLGLEWMDGPQAEVKLSLSSPQQANTKTPPWPCQRFASVNAWARVRARDVCDPSCPCLPAPLLKYSHPPLLLFPHTHARTHARTSAWLPKPATTTTTTLFWPSAAHAMAQEDVHHLDDASLALGLSLGGGGGVASDVARQQSTGARLSREAPSPRALEPSLTLSMPDEATTATGSGGGGGAGGGPARSVSSLSVAGVKRERVEEADGEHASSAAARAHGAGAEDDDDGSTRKKLRLTKEQSALLEDRFKEHSTLNPLKQTEVDCEFLKRCCESLTEENRRLQRELQELRALKLAPPAMATAAPPHAAGVAPPFYMQLPAATLTLCPSCERLGGPAAAAKADPDRPKAAATHHFFNPFTHSAAC